MELSPGKQLRRKVLELMDLLLLLCPACVSVSAGAAAGVGAGVCVSCRGLDGAVRSEAAGGEGPPTAAAQRTRSSAAAT